MCVFLTFREMIQGGVCTHEVANFKRVANCTGGWCGYLALLESADRIPRMKNAKNAAKGSYKSRREKHKLNQVKQLKEKVEGKMRNDMTKPQKNW